MAAAKDSTARRLLAGAGAALLYFAAAWPAIPLTHTNNASPVWPAAGVAFAMALWRGPGIWPWIFAADVLVGALFFPRGEGLPPVVQAILIVAVAAGDTLEALAARWLVRRTLRSSAGLATVRGVWRLLLAAPAACAISATVGTACLAVAEPAVPPLEVWFTWWMGDIAGCAVFGPALFLWLTKGRIAGWEARRVIELVASLIVTAVLTAVAFGALLLPARPHYPLGFLVLPGLVWLAARFGPREAAAGIAISAGIVTFLTARGSGPFWVGATNTSILVAQAHILVTCGTVLALAAAISDRRRAFHRVLAGRARLEQRVSERTAVVERQAQQLRVLASRLAASASRVRQRIAFVLHEDLQQLLVAARLRLLPQGSPSRTGAGLDAAARQDLDRLLEKALATSRDLALQLVPPELGVGGLRVGLMWLARRMKDAHGLDVRLEYEESDGRVDREAGVAAFDAVRELLFNVVNHADVQSARVQCRVGENVNIEVSDEGRGFDPGMIEEAGSHGPLGLYSLRERLRAVGGNLRIDSGPGRGTRVFLRMPRAGAVPGALA